MILIFKNSTNLLPFHLLNGVLLVWFPPITVNVSPGGDEMKRHCEPVLAAT